MSFRIRRVGEQLEDVNFEIVGQFGLYHCDRLVLVDPKISEVFFYYYCVRYGGYECDSGFFDALKGLDLFELAVLVEELEVQDWGLYSLGKSSVLARIKKLFIEGGKKC